MDTIQKFFNDGDYNSVEKYLNSLPNKNTINYHYLKGMLHYAKREYAQSRNFLNVCYANDPKNLEYMRKLIEINYNIEDYQQTAIICQKFLTLNNNISVLYAFGSCLTHLKMYTDAISILELCYSEKYNVIDTVDKLIHCSFNTSDSDRLRKYCSIYGDIIPGTTDRKSIYMILGKLFLEGRMQSREKIFIDREMFSKGLDELTEAKLTIDDLNSVISPWTAKLGFPLSYHHQNNTDYLKRLSHIYRLTCPDLNYVAKHCKYFVKKANSKIRVGFISSFFRHHSVAKDRRGIMKLLDRNIYEVYSLFMNDVVDELSVEIWEATIPIRLNNSIYKAREQIEALELDILVYCEIGMSMPTYLLSHFRLAHVQLNTWGHSDTSGVNTIDYYVSSQLYEIDDNPQSHYSEKLIMNKGLCTYYYNPIKFLTRPLTPLKPIIDAFVNKHIYVCPGTLIKLHPDMDIILNKILEADDLASIVMMDDGVHRNTFESRLIQTVGDKINRVGFIPTKYDVDYFSGILASGHVILDTYPFGGCNSSFEAFAIGKPVVTLPGEFINGRFTYGFYKKMDMMELVARDIDDYVRIAVKLASDDTYNKMICDEIKLRSPILFENTEAVDEWNIMLKTLYSFSLRKSSFASIKDLETLLVDIRSHLLQTSSLNILYTGCSMNDEVDMLTNIFPYANIDITDWDDDLLDIYQMKYRHKTINCIKYKDVTTKSYDVIICMSTLCRLNNDRNIYTYVFSDFETELLIFDKSLRRGGLLVIYGSNYSFLESDISQKYMHINSDVPDSSVQMYNKNGLKIPQSNKIIFAKY